MKVLITGGAGYIGSHSIIEIFDKTDWQLLSLDNYSNSSPRTYERISDITERKVNHVELDLTDAEALLALFEKERFDGVMHFAALKAVGESVDRPLHYYKNNVNGLINLIEAMTKFEVEHMLFSSSCTVYGNNADLPVTEKSKAGVAESPYGWTKVMGEQILQDAAAKGDIKVLALRYFNPVGAHHSGCIGELPMGVPNNLVPYVTQTAAGKRDQLTIFGNDYETRDGTCIRDYVHVSDIARAHVLGLERLLGGEQKERFDFINLGTGNGVSVKEVVTAFEQVNQVDLPHVYGPRRSGDVVSMYADNSKAKDLLNWSPEFGLEEMMSSAWKWQQHLDQES